MVQKNPDEEEPLAENENVESDDEVRYQSRSKAFAKKNNF